jgi:hypothetical protein
MRRSTSRALPAAEVVICGHGDLGVPQLIGSSPRRQPSPVHQGGHRPPQGVRGDGPWSGFAATLGAIAGALAGLLFVAVSIKSDALSASQNLRSRAAQSLCLFMVDVLIALIVTPPQPRVALGVELLLLAVSSGLLMVILGRRAGHGSARSATWYLERFSPNALTPLLIGLGGVTLLLEAGGGLYWLLAAAVASLLGGVVGAWLFLVKITA